jgi:hypothetical protein
VRGTYGAADGLDLIELVPQDGCKLPWLHKESPTAPRSPKRLMPKPSSILLYQMTCRPTSPTTKKPQPPSRHGGKAHRVRLLHLVSFCSRLVGIMQLAQ